MSTTTAPKPPPVELPVLPETKPWRYDILQHFPAIKWLVQRRWFQFAVILPNVFFFLFFLAAGIFGSPVGNRNIIIIFVWIFWWFLLISLMVPFASRIWCAACPFPFFGEWMQRRALVKVRAVDPKAKKKSEGPGVLVGRNRYFGKNLRWPKALSNIWLQNIGFLGMCTFSALLLTRPIVTVVALGGLIVAATILHRIYRQRAFCNYVCPVSGFLSLYSMASKLEVRSKDAEVCLKCTNKGCLAGNENGWGCPWGMYPSKMDRNNYCGLCMECIKTCPYDNMTVNFRPFASDTRLKGYDEAFKAFIMLTLAITYSFIYLGPWGFLKDWTNVSEARDYTGFLAYVTILWSSALVLIPGVYYVSVWIGRKLAGATERTPKEIFLGFVYPLVPFGLLAWTAFSLPLVLVNGSYILVVLSDPLGWGWDLFGTATIPWTPVIPHWTPYFQVPLLLIGLYYALKTGYEHSHRLYGATRQAVRAFAPVAVLLTTFTIVFFALYLG